jgi:hypothetical protein
MLSEIQAKVSGEKYEDIQTSEYRPNRTRIKEMWGNCSESVPLEALQGLNGQHVNLYSCSFMLEKMRLMNSCIKCQLDESCKSRNNSPMVIEVIENEYERASYVDHGSCKISKRNFIKTGSTLDIYVDAIQEYGFNHIILIGKRECGIIFLDCYGRVFALDMMSKVLWPLGDT